MTRIQLTINDKTRWIDALQYEYFTPVCKSEEKYRKTLQKNFPYDFGDDTDLFPYSTVTLPTLTTDALAKRLNDDAKWETQIYDPSFRSASVFRERKSKKDFYYDRLTELRYDKGLDRDIIPNLHNLYDMETRPSNSRDFPDIGRVIGGIFELEFDSTDDDDFFYQWLLSGTMNNGEMVFYKGDHEEQFIKIKFWDCYCTEIEERMSSVDCSPMKMKIRISPAITENRGIKHEKSWKVTKIVNKPFKPEPHAPPVPLVTAVKGKATALPSEEVEYRVTGYNLSTVDDSDRKRVKWVVEIEEKKLAQQKHGEVLDLLIEEEWAGQNICVYPYLQNPDKKVSVETKVLLEPQIKLIITNEITGYTIQGLKGLDFITSDPAVIVPTYKVNVVNYDKEYPKGKLEFSFDVTRDAWYCLGRVGKTYKLLNRAFIPADWKRNLYEAFWIPSYPRFSGMGAFILTRFGERKLPAKPLLTNRLLNGKLIDSPRENEHFATDVMIHVGGVYEIMGYDHLGGSYGCFGFIPKDDIYSTPELAEKAIKNDDYDDKTSNIDWKNITNKILELSFPKKKKIKILLEYKDESQNYIPKIIYEE